MNLRALVPILLFFILLSGCIAEAKAAAKDTLKNGKDAIDSVSKPNVPADFPVADTDAPSAVPQPALNLTGPQAGAGEPAKPLPEPNAPTASGTVSIPSEIERNCIGFVVGTPEELRTVGMIGAGWARPHPGPFSWGRIETSRGTYDFSETDRWVLEAQDNNVSLLATIFPYADWDQAACHNKECAVSDADMFYPKGTPEDAYFSIPAHRCAPCDPAEYDRFLTKLVERYDGDGADDMPGLRIPIKYYEILNEPEMNSSLLTFFRGGPREYASILMDSYTAINNTCPDCSVLQGAVASQQKSSDQYWRQVFTAASGGAYFDIGNIHFVGIGDEQSLNVKHLAALLRERDISKPIWVTEAQFSGPLSDPKASLRGAWGQGARKVFYTSFIVGRQSAPEPGKYSPVYAELPGLCGK